MKPTSLLLFLLLVVALSGCTSARQAALDTPRWIDQHEDIQFDFTLPVFKYKDLLGVKVNVSFNGRAEFYLHRKQQPYRIIMATDLDEAERAHLAALFEGSGFASYPQIVPRGGQVLVPARVVHLGYRAQAGQPHQSVSGAVAQQRQEGDYPEGFYALLDGLAAFVAATLEDGPHPCRYPDEGPAVSAR